MFGTNPVVRYLNQNRRQIIVFIIAIVMIIVVLRVLNGIAEQNQKEQIKDQKEVSLSENEKYAFIKKFVNYCYKKDESNAYALLSLNAKKEYSSKEQFKERFINKYFKDNKTYSLSSSSENTYTIKVKDDALSTGKINSNEDVVSFNIVVEKEDNEYKINLK